MCLQILNVAATCDSQEVVVDSGSDGYCSANDRLSSDGGALVVDVVIEGVC